MPRRSSRLLQRAEGVGRSSAMDVDEDSSFMDVDASLAGTTGNGMVEDGEGEYGEGQDGRHARAHRRPCSVENTLPGVSQTQSVHDFLTSREVVGGRQPKAHLPRSICSRLPHLLKEKELCTLEKYDKIFASAWLDSDRVICGTKDNQLVVWNVVSGKHYTLPSYLFEGFRVDHCGIHSISISSEGLIATGGQQPEDIMILSKADVRPKGLLRGHQDWVFGISWLTHNILVSGSRDKMVMVWNVDRMKRGVGKPFQVRQGHEDKVRDMSVDAVRGEFASLSADATVKTWTADSPVPKSSTDLVHKAELVCMACDLERGAYAVGSESHVQIVDPRARRVACVFDAVEEKCGIRSLSFNGHILTVGGGSGTLSFWDMAAHKYLELENAGGCKSLRTGKGWIKKDEVFHMHFWDQETPNTVYTHCYDPTRTRLFVGGGPLPFGLCGSYAAIW
mmetsp:Transcript_51764/g.128807  ORF Transcript_51764/g.128807 Transcript_51764/m.128807 type:complete len:449 (-) Transcript_51764:216-1562(-)